MAHIDIFHKKKQTDTKVSADTLLGFSYGSKFGDDDDDWGRDNRDSRQKKD